MSLLCGNSWDITRTYSLTHVFVPPAFFSSFLSNSFAN